MQCFGRNVFRMSLPLGIWPLYKRILKDDLCKLRGFTIFVNFVERVFKLCFNLNLFSAIVFFLSFCPFPQSSLFVCLSICLTVSFIVSKGCWKKESFIRSVICWPFKKRIFWRHFLGQKVVWRCIDDNFLDNAALSCCCMSALG